MADMQRGQVFSVRTRAFFGRPLMCLTLSTGSVKADYAMISPLTDGIGACDDRILHDSHSFVASSITNKVKQDKRCVSPREI